MVIDSIDEGFFSGDITFCDPHRTSSQWRGRGIEQISVYDSTITEMECGNIIAFVSNFDFSMPPLPSSVRPLTASLPPIPPLPPTSFPNIQPVLPPANIAPPPMAYSLPTIPPPLPPPPVKLIPPANGSFAVPSLPFIDKSPVLPPAYVPAPLPTIPANPITTPNSSLKMDPIPSFTTPSYAQVDPLAPIKLPQVEITLPNISKQVESPNLIAALPPALPIEKPAVTIPIQQAVPPIPKVTSNGTLSIASSHGNEETVVVPVTTESKPTSMLQNIKHGASQVTGRLLHEVWDIVGGLGTETTRFMDLVCTPFTNNPPNFEQNAQIANQKVHEKIEEVFGVSCAMHLPGVVLLQAPAPGGASTLTGRVTQVAALEGSAARVSSIGRAALVEEIATASYQAIPEQTASLEAQAISTTSKLIATNDPIATVVVKENTSIKVEFFGNNLKHIFRDAPGHLADTAINRQLLIDTASNPKNYLGKDKFGNEWYVQKLENGTQSWTQVFEGKIRNGGLNQEPRNFDSVITVK